MKRVLIILLLMVSVFAVTLDYNSYSTAPSTIKDQGYLYITFCSTSDSSRNFDLTPQGFSASPRSIEIDFDGTSSIPDCKQMVVLVNSDEPGLFNLLIEQGGDEWVLPVEFSQSEPVSIDISDPVVYTGYDPVEIRVNGIGEDVWLTLGSSVVGSNSMHRDSLPAIFPVIFHFSETGFNEVPLTLTYDINNYTMTQTYTLGLRVEQAPIRVSENIRVPSEGYTNLTFRLTLPEKLYSDVVTISSPCLSGSLSDRVENFQEGDVSFSVKGDCDPGIYEMNISAGDFETTVPLTVYGPEGFEIFYNTFVKDEIHSIEVVLANEGSQTMKAVSMRLLDGNYKKIKEGSFIGDLDFGDFDSSELKFIPNSKSVDLAIKISYTMDGERKELIKHYSYTRPSQSGFMKYVIWAFIIGGVVFYVRRRKARR